MNDQKSAKAQFQVTTLNGAHVVLLPAILDATLVSMLEVEVKSWQLNPADVHVIDMKELITLSPQTYRVLIQYNTALKSAKKHLFVTNVSSKIMTQLKADGLTNVFVPVASV